MPTALRTVATYRDLTPDGLPRSLQQNSPGAGGDLPATVISEYGWRLVLDIEHARVMHGRVMLGLGSGVLEASKRAALRIGIDPEAIPPGHSKHGMWVEPGDAFAGNDDVSVFRSDLPARNDALDDVGQSLSRSDADRPFR